MVTQAADRFFHHLDIYGRSGQISLRPIGFLDYQVTIVSSVMEEYERPTVLHPQAAGDPRDAKHLQQTLAAA